MKGRKYLKQPELVLYGTRDIEIPEITVQYSTDKKPSQGQITTSDDVAEFVRKVLPELTIELQEHFIILYLNRNHKIKGYYHHSKGGVSGTIADPKIILSTALKTLSSSIILVHNHPSGSTKPSEADISLTEKIKQAAKLMDVEVLDHVIITKDNHYSFADEGIMGLGRIDNTNKKNINKMGKQVESIKEEIKFIKRFVNLQNKTKTPESILAFIKALQRSIVQKLIRKTSPYKKEIEEIQNALIDGYNRMKGPTKIFMNEGILERFRKIAQGESVYPSIQFIKRFIGLQGKKIDFDKKVKFLKQLKNAAKNQRILENDPYAEKVEEIYEMLKSSDINKKITISASELNGLKHIVNESSCQEGIGKIYDTKGKSVRRCKSSKYSDAGKGACSYNRGLGKIYDTKGKKIRRCKSGKYSDARKGACSYNKGLSGIVSSVDFVKVKFDKLGLKGKWLEFIGDPSPGFSAMIFGKPKFGKSYLSIDFAGYLARNHGKTLYVAKEEALDDTLQTKLKEKDVAHPDLDVSDILPSNLSFYKFVFLDSVTDLNFRPEDLKALEAKYPEISFIYIFQVRKDGAYRGANSFEHNVDVVINLPEKGLAVQNGRFNQGGEMKIFENDKLK